MEELDDGNHFREDEKAAANAPQSRDMQHLIGH